MSGQKLGHKVNSSKNHVNTLEGIVLNQSLWNYVKMFVIICSWPNLKLGQVRSKTRSLGQIFEKNVYTL